MKKASGKSKAKASKPRAKRQSKAKKPADLAEVRRDIADIVTGAAGELTKAVVDEGRKGQLAPVKYLFEVAGLYPTADGEKQQKPEEASLAKTLLNHLGLSTDPQIQQDKPHQNPNVSAGKPANEKTAEAEDGASNPEKPK
jgi:hypothetical protein